MPNPTHTVHRIITPKSHPTLTENWVQARIDDKLAQLRARGRKLTSDG